jgi:hypothetical protein
MGTLKIRHQGYDFEALRSLIHTMVEKLPDVVGRINKFNDVEISDENAAAFAAEAMSTQLLSCSLGFECVRNRPHIR